MIEEIAIWEPAHVRLDGKDPHVIAQSVIRLAWTGMGACAITEGNVSAVVANVTPSPSLPMPCVNLAAHCASWGPVRMFAHVRSARPGALGRRREKNVKAVTSR